MKVKGILSALILTGMIIGLAACRSNEDVLPVNDDTPPAYEIADEDPDEQLIELPEPPNIPDYPIVVNGVGLEHDFYTPEGETVPTHVPLTPILNELGVDWGTNHVLPMVFTLSVSEGTIDITDRSRIVIFNGEEKEMTHYAMFSNHDLYVPISFFSDIFGMSSAFWVDGYVYLAD